MNQIATHDLNTFRVGDTVSIPEVPDFHNVRIDRISDTGVTVSGSKCGSDINISGKSPAFLVKRDGKEYNADYSASIRVVKTDSDGVEIPESENGERVKRGTYTEKMKNLTMPEHDKPFTIKQFAELNGIPTGYATAWVKENATECGFAEKPEGQRGKAATLFKL